MKISWLLCGAAAMVGAALPAAAADYVTTVKASSPLAYFRLTGTNDPSQVNGYTTSYTATTGTTAPGGGAPIAADPANSAAIFTGNNSAPSEVHTGLSGGIPGAGSINAWINLAALPSSVGLYYTIAGESQPGNDFDLQIQNDNRLYIYTGAGENTSYALPIAGLVGNWHMITATYMGGSNGFRDLYVDGAQVATFNGGVNAQSKTSQFNIGYSDVFGGRDFNGKIDEVAVWGYGLSATQVGNIYVSANNPATGGTVPEPASWAMLLTGFGIIGGAMRRRAGTVSVAA